MFASQIYNDVNGNSLTRNWVYSYNFNEGSAATSGMYASSADWNILYSYVQTTTGSKFYLVTVTFSTASSGSMVIKTITGFSGNGNSLNAAAFSSPTVSYYVAKVVSLKDQTGAPINFSPLVTAFMNSDPSVSCFNAVDTYATVTITSITYTWGTMSDPLPYITGYQILNHGGAALQALTSTSVVSPDWCLDPPTITLPTNGPYYYSVYSDSTTFTLPDFGTNHGCLDATFTYTLINTGTGVAPASPFTWSSTNSQELTI